VRFIGKEFLLMRREPPADDAQHGRPPGPERPTPGSGHFPSRSPRRSIG
jgi:hypothetical protein